MKKRNMSTSAQLSASNDVMISIYTKSTFVGNQPDGWIVDRDTGKLRCHDDAVTVLVHSKENRIFGEKNSIEVRLNIIMIQ